MEINRNTLGNTLGQLNEQNHQVINCNCFSNKNENVTNSDRETIKHKENGNVNNESTSLQARVEALRETMINLKEELFEEKALWKKETEQLLNLMNCSESFVESETSLLGDIEYDLKPIPSIQTNVSDLIISSPIIRDYEEKITRYQGALAQAQAEKRYNIRRQIAANSYRKRLNEVEKLCQEELAKVRETATYLEPLKQMASEWSKSKSNTIEGSNNTAENSRRRLAPNVECGGDFVALQENQTQEEAFEVPVKQIDASLVVDEDASNEIKGKIVLQIGSLPSEVPTICYSAKFE